MASVLHGSARTTPRLRCRAPGVARGHPVPCRPLWAEPEDRSQMAQADHGGGYPDDPSRRFLGPHIFDRVCIVNGIEHRLTKPCHPWTNGQAGA